MPMPNKPGLPIPPPLTGAEFGSFAHDTIIRRMPEIGRRTLAENDFAPEIVRQLENLIDSIPSGEIRQIEGSKAPDAVDWQGYISPYLGQNWLQVPWFFAETYFYRCVLEATAFFEASPGSAKDPYAHQKRQGLETTTAQIRALSTQVSDLWEAGGASPENMDELLMIALWGNRADLSLWPVQQDSPTSQPESKTDLTHLLIDHRFAISHYLARRQNGIRVDIIADNAGLELVSDLLFVDFLLRGRNVAGVHFHLKAHPTFVSDATVYDVRHSIQHLAKDPHAETQQVGARLQDCLERGRVQLHAHPFWTSPLEMWKLPDELRAQLTRSDLVVCKGDANYRRLLGDRHWNFTTAFEAIVAYFPAPIVALRTCKSEVACGFETAQIETLSAIDPNWLINGRWGVIQYHGAPPGA